MHALSILGFSSILTPETKFSSVFSSNEKQCIPFPSSVPAVPDASIRVTQPDKVVFFLMRALENADKHAYFHSINHAAHSYNFGTRLNLPKTALEELYYASLLHDIGKIFFTELFTLPRKLTADEYTELQQHSIVSFIILSACDFPRLIALSGLFHHLSHDRQHGYPIINDELVKRIEYIAQKMQFPVPRWTLINFNEITSDEWRLLSIVVLMDALDAAIDPHRLYKTAIPLSQLLNDFESSETYGWRTMFDPSLKSALESYVGWLTPYTSG